MKYIILLLFCTNAMAQTILTVDGASYTVTGTTMLTTANAYIQGSNACSYEADQLHRSLVNQIFIDEMECSRYIVTRSRFDGWALSSWSSPGERVRLRKDDSDGRGFWYMYLSQTSVSLIHKPSHRSDPSDFTSGELRTGDRNICAAVREATRLQEETGDL